MHVIEANYTYKNTIEKTPYNRTSIEHVHPLNSLPTSRINLQKGTTPLQGAVKVNLYSPRNVNSTVYRYDYLLNIFNFALNAFTSMSCTECMCTMFDLSRLDLLTVLVWSLIQSPFHDAGTCVVLLGAV